MNAIRSSQPPVTVLPDISGFTGRQQPDADVFIQTLQGIGGQVVRVTDTTGIIAFIRENYPAGNRVVTALPGLSAVAETAWFNGDAHDLSNVQFAVFASQLGVCENGAVWLDETALKQRAVPFITENLGIVLHTQHLVRTMHEAYQALGNRSYGYGTFIAGPSKTADIEQSLVLGAHGARTLTIFLVQ